MAPDFRLPFGHRHSEQEEIYVVLEGGARFKVEDEIVEMRTFDALRVPPGTTRGMEAGPEGALILAVGAPNTENRDTEMVQDFWPVTAPRSDVRVRARPDGRGLDDRRRRLAQDGEAVDDLLEVQHVADVGAHDVAVVARHPQALHDLGRLHRQLGDVAQQAGRRADADHRRERQAQRPADPRGRGRP